jgi:hypothetical protein
MGGYNFKNKSYFLTFPRAFETNTLGYELWKNAVVISVYLKPSSNICLLIDNYLNFMINMTVSTSLFCGED